MAITFLLICIIASCARLGTPQGGPRDEQPPSILEDRSTKNYQTNFEKQDIVLEFDEWIKILNPLKEVVVSPPTDYPIKFAVKGKKGVFEFAEEEVLKEDVTYQINFGDAIQDFTEGNILKNHVFVFSTGDKLDSLTLSGNVTDALDNSPKEDVLVMLYDNLSDTAFFSRKPLYFTRSDEEGNYQLQNIKNDTFRLYALIDNNVNYFYDQGGEYVGFLDSLIVLNDSTENKFDLEVFDELDSTRIIEFTQEKKGLIKVLFNNIPSEISVLNSLGYPSYHTQNLDTLKIWHQDMESDSSEFYISYDNKIDTILNKKSRKRITDTPISISRSQAKNLSGYKGDSISIEFNHFLSITQDSLSAEISDTISSYKITDYSTEGRFLYLHLDTIPVGSAYNLIIEPNRIQNIYGSAYSDTIKYPVNVKDPSELGNISLNIKKKNSEKFHMILLKGEKEIAEHSIQSDTLIQLRKMEAGSYKLKIIEEIIRDQKWTPGNVKEKRQSERIKEVPLEELRAGWELELDVDINQIFDGTEGQ